MPPPATPPTPPPPSTPPVQNPNTRYIYLVARLRNRQITMEEAIELFALMDESIRVLRAATARPVAPPPAPAMIEAKPPPAVPGAGLMGGMTPDDMLAAGILLIGAGAGVSAALRERSKSGPKTPPTPSKGLSDALKS